MRHSNNNSNSPSRPAMDPVQVVGTLDLIGQSLITHFTLMDTIGAFEQPGVPTTERSAMESLLALVRLIRDDAAAKGDIQGEDLFLTAAYGAASALFEMDCEQYGDCDEDQA